MKKFVLKTLFFFVPIFFLLLEPFLPLSFFTFRPWEALKYNHDGVGMPFYPCQELNMISVGDLCYYTKNAIEKNENWVTDEKGYRNDIFIDNPDVLIIGDSFVAGSGLTQDSTLTNLMLHKSRAKLSVYNIAPATFSDFIALYEQHLIKKPKLVVFSIVERNIPSNINVSSSLKVFENSSYASIYKNRINRMYLREFLLARINNKHGKGIQSLSNPRMFFMDGNIQKNYNKKISEAVSNIISYKEYCDSLGIKFIFMCLPNKETVYFDEVPLINQPNYINKLDSVLKLNKIVTLNPLKIFNDYRKNQTDLIYHLDDSHWNSRGVNLIAGALLNKINDMNYIDYLTN